MIDAARPRVGFIGGGRVGKGLSLAFSRCGYDVVGVAGRSPREKQIIFENASVVFLTVPDDALPAVAREQPWRVGKSAVHCSGAAELTVLDHAKQAGAQVGGFHPLQMFADPEVSARGLKGCAIAVEGLDPLAATLLRMVTDIGARPLRVPPGARAAYHAGAHYAGPFIAALLAEAVTIWGRIGISEEDALAALLPLARGSLDAMAHSGLPRAMAGSVARGDIQTLRRHVDSLAALDPALKDFYCSLALKTVPLALSAGKLDAARAARIREMLEGSNP
ncbi:MAG TPA: DUF2520 domain-containing protein [Burkholderiales bacterium]|nr:DUF2520 domain-containing protein [Burkholderiales bacterium]